MGIRERTETKLLDAADELFFTRGIAATPIDAVIEKAGVSAATLYRGYPSKEALVAATLERRHRQWLEIWEAAVARRSVPATRLLAVFDALDEFRERPTGSRWCAFLGSAAEYVDAPDELAAAIRADTDALRSRLIDLARDVAPGHAEELAEELLLVVTGDLAMRLRDPGSSTRTARRTAARLIASFTPNRS